jgi:virulence-associated protein VapD
MYAVTFEIDTNCLNNEYHTQSSNNAYKDIRVFMEKNNFKWQQGSVYFGDETINAVSCVITIQKLSKKYSWFAVCVKDVRMLKIQENNDLMPVLNI